MKTLPFNISTLKSIKLYHLLTQVAYVVLNSVGDLGNFVNLWELKFLKRLLLLCLILMGVLPLQAQRTIYVNDNATGLNNGNNWANAYTDLQEGLLAAQIGDMIWVAKGIYKPTNNTDRTISFQLQNGVAIYAGFEGTENTIEERDLTQIDNLQTFLETADANSLDKQTLVNSFSATILSGDIGVQNNREDNSLHVIRGDGIDTTALLNGLVIMEGDANVYTNQTDYHKGGGMYNHKSSPMLISCIFIANSGLDGGAIFNDESSPRLTNTSFFQNQTSSSGGGIHNYKSSPRLENCYFRQNGAEFNGGGMYNGFDSKAVLNSCVFELNNAKDGGGVNNFRSSPQLTDCYFISNSAFVSGAFADGGGIYNKESSPTLNNCHFNNNSASASGGGIANQAGSSPILTNCDFNENTSGINGGAMFNGSTSNPTLANCHFVSNNAQNGGAINNFNSSPELTDCHFTSNNADFGGGMLNIQSKPRFKNVRFESNTANNSGGGMYNFTSFPELEVCWFVSNRSNRNGGGMINDESSPSLDSCFFQENYASTNGGGMANQPLSSPILNGCSFKENTAGFNGGGMFNDSASVTVLNSCIFELNKARNGGGMNNFKSSPQLTECQFVSNRSNDNGGGINNAESSPTLNNCLFQQNSASASGGGMANQPRSFPTLKNCDFKENTAGFNGGGMFSGFVSGPKLDSCNFDANEAKNGGGMNNFQSSPQLTNCHFNSNRAEFGGGMYNRIFGEPKLTTCTFKGNLAFYNDLFSTGGDGGGIYNENCSPILFGCTFEENRASSSPNNHGGGIYNDGSSPSLDSCYFIKNSAGSRGGGMANQYSRPSNPVLQESSPTLGNCYFLENIAGDSGGGMYNDSASVTVLEYCNFESNHAQNGDGGGIHYFKSSSTITNSNFITCVTGQNGGGIFIEGGLIFLKNSLFNENLANNGGGIFVDQEENAQLHISNCTFSSNEASQDGGGIFNGQTINLLGSTLYQNKAAESGANIYMTSQGGLTLRQNIIAGNNVSPDFYLEPSANIISEGYNLVGNGEEFDSWQLSDLVGNSTLYIDPMLEPLADNGGPTQTHALKKGSPAINAGELLYVIPKDIIFDQRGYSRINSPQDSLSDIGAYERHSIEVKTAENFTICDVDSFQIIDDIILTDPSGGAFVVGDSLTLDLELPMDFDYNTTLAEISVGGEGLKILSSSFDLPNRQLHITYNRAYTNAPDSIIIRGIQAKFSGETPKSGKILRTGGTAQQIDNSPSDSIAFGILTGFPTKTISQRYIENFEASKGNWLALGNNNLWEWGVPKGTVINNEASANKAWKTGLNTSYAASETYILESGCFDYSRLQNPVINLDIWSDTEEGFDGTVLQFSDDRGETWETIGGVNTGNGWYNSENILGNPGEQFKGWSGRDTTWRLSAHLLPDRSTNAPKVRFRLAFGSSILVDPTQSNNGFAFDNLFIGEQGVNLLFEQHTNLDSESLGDKVIADNPNSLIPIRYFISKGETFYEKNPAGPRSRALYYGISEPGISVVNGIDYLGPTAGIDQHFLDKNKLKGSIINIDIDPTDPNALIQITPAREFINEELIVYIALIENGVKDKSTTYSYVFRTFLPNAAGISYWDWQVGHTEVFPLSWFENQPSISSYVDNVDSLRLVVFVQNQQTKEVYQATSAEVWPTLITALENRKGALYSDASLSLYPNPASNYLTLELERHAEEPFKVSCYNLQGAEVKEFRLEKGRIQYRLDLNELAIGWYYVRVGTTDEIWLQDKVTVIR